MSSNNEFNNVVALAGRFVAILDGDSLFQVMHNLQHFLTSPAFPETFEDFDPPSPSAIGIILAFVAHIRSGEGYQLLRLVLERFVEIASRPGTTHEQIIRAHNHIFLLQPLADPADVMTALLQPALQPELYHGAMAMFKATAPDALVARLEHVQLEGCSKEWERPLPAGFFDTEPGTGKLQRVCRVCKNGGVKQQDIAIVQARLDFIEQWVEEGGAMPNRPQRKIKE